MTDRGPRDRIHIRLDAVILAVTEGQVDVLVIDNRQSEAKLPSGALDDIQDETLELGLRRIVRQQTGLELGYVEQLYTFGDKARDPGTRQISVAYLALYRRREKIKLDNRTWLKCYALFPWEDWRSGQPTLMEREIVPLVNSWSARNPADDARSKITFGLEGSPWDGVRVLERYELLYEMGAIPEYFRDICCDIGMIPRLPKLGHPLALDHRRIVATALSRIRGKLAYRPVVFELLPETFTISELQRVVECLAGIQVHTPNFHRMVERNGLIERSGDKKTSTRGRPPHLYRFRNAVLRERPKPGIGPHAPR